MPADPTSDLAILDRLVQPAGKDVLDIGCGGGALVRELAGRGSRVTGVEVSQAQLAPALARAGGDGERYLVGSAQALPLEDGCVDIAVFMRTLHHVPSPDLSQALREARRVLRPGGVVYVAEPLASGDYFALMSLVEDEREVREAAAMAIADAADAGLDLVRTLVYEVRFCIAGLAALRARVVSVDPERARRFDARESEIAQAFATLGAAGKRPGERCFVQPMRADVLHAGS